MVLVRSNPKACAPSLLIADAIYYECCPTGCVGDVDANGTIDIYDLLTVLENWGVCP